MLPTGPKLAIRRFDGQNFDVPIREIDPVMNRVSGDDTDFNAPADLIVFVRIGILIRCRTQPDEMIEQASSSFLLQGIEKGNHFEIDEEPVIHEPALFGITLLQLIEFDPVRRILIVDFLRERALEIRVLLRLP